MTWAAIAAGVPAAEAAPEVAATATRVAALRHEALSFAADAVRAVVQWHRPVRWGGRVRPGPAGQLGLDPARFGEAMHALRNLPEPYPFGDVATLFDEHVSRFVPGAARWGTWKRLEASDVHEHLFGPLGLIDEAMLVVEDDGHVVAAISVYRRRRQGELGRDDLARLDELAPRIIDAFVRSHRLERELLPDVRGLVVLGGDGRVEMANEAAARWLALVDALGYGAGVAPLPPTIDGAVGALHAVGPAVAELMRLEGTDGEARYLVEVTAPEAPRRRRAVFLTDRQREVAAFASHGATVPEIARHLGLGRETVRAHLKEVYRRLGVSNRAELVKTLDGVAPQDPVASSRPRSRTPGTP